MKKTGKTLRVFCLAAAALLLAGCAKNDPETPEAAQTPLITQNAAAETAEAMPAVTPAAETEIPAEEDTEMKLSIGTEDVKVEWESNESVEALMALVKEGPLTINMSMYGGFEQVGEIGKSLPRSDSQTTTRAGDIVLYSGNKIVVFYGSNSWAYTRLGRITDRSAEELSALLGNGNVTLTISLSGN